MKSSISSAIERIISHTTGIAVIVGTPIPLDPSCECYANERYYNSALVIQDKQIIKQVNKILVPNYEVFNEIRYFYPGDQSVVVELFGIKIGIQICEDMWDHIPFYENQMKVTKEAVKQGAELIINISASPFSLGKAEERLEIVKNHVLDNKVPFIYVNENPDTFVKSISH